MWSSVMEPVNSNSAGKSLLSDKAANELVGLRLTVGGVLSSVPIRDCRPGAGIAEDIASLDLSLES